MKVLIGSPVHITFNHSKTDMIVFREFPDFRKKIFLKSKLSIVKSSEMQILVILGRWLTVPSEPEAALKLATIDSLRRSL